MDKSLLSFLTGRDDGYITRKDIAGIFKLPAIIVFLITIPFGVGANFVEQKTSLLILFGISVVFALTAFFSTSNRSKIIALVCACFWTFSFIIFAAMQTARS